MTNKNTKPFMQRTFTDVLYKHFGKMSAYFAILVLGIIALIRAKPEDIPEIFKSIFISNIIFWVGWIIAAIFLIILLNTSRILRIYKEEIDRVCKERDKLQEFLLKKAVERTERSE